MFLHKCDLVHVVFSLPLYGFGSGVSFCLRYVCFFFSPSDFILDCAFLYYYHLNINVVGYNSVGFIILCTEWTAHTGHLYHSLIHYAYVCWCLCMLNHFAIDLHWKWLRLFRMCMLVHSNYSSDKNTGNISEKNIADKKSVCVFFSFIPLVFV